MKLIFTSLPAVAAAVLIALCVCTKQLNAQASFANEQYRPQIHFSPKAKWMNDPNGMVYYNHTYHLYYQYYPDSTVWGPMHWGHAASKDLVHWTHQPIALYPDSLGYIFSGSAVADVHNTSGFGKGGKVPLVAVFTSHNPKGAKQGRNDYQNQSIAYSLDEGRTWTKYAANPVVKNPGLRDFRDPKVSWYEEGKKWIMTLATQDHVTFFSSPNLKDWKKESEFGKTLGAHGGVWECPDLFALEDKGKKVWVLFVSLNPGGPNGGSATQYFTGNFDGTTFTPFQTDTRWVDYGPDDYAGVTWSNTGNRRIFLGWMNNWQYANVVPTRSWRGATTVPRELGLQKKDGQYFLTSKPVAELNAVTGAPLKISGRKEQAFTSPARLELKAENAADFSIVFSNRKGQQVVVGYDRAANQYFIDRQKSGKVSFSKVFAARHTAPRLRSGGKMELTLLLDKASVELFGDGGMSVMTEVFFPDEDLSTFSVQPSPDLKMTSLQLSPIQSMYRNQ